VPETIAQLPVVQEIGPLLALLQILAVTD